METRDFNREVQMACDDLYVNPESEQLRVRLRNLLGSSPGATALASPKEFRRRLLVACDELHDDPDDVDAQHTLLMLLSGPSPVAVA
jgi:hypothetical protein